MTRSTSAKREDSTVQAAQGVGKAALTPAERVDGTQRQAPAVRVAGVAKQFGTTTAIQSVDLELTMHDRLSIVGPSGCGKSTLLGIISGLDEPDEGIVTVLGETKPDGRLRKCAWMPQRDLLLPWRDVLGNAAISIENRGVRPKAARRQVADLASRFGLAGFEDRYPYQLSGGMRQRVSFLRTLSAGKEVLLFDEPFGALDSITRADLQLWLRSALDDEPRTTILVTHDVEEALLLGNKVVVMSARPGRVQATFDVELPVATSRRDLIRLPEFAELRDQILGLLEGS